MRNSIIKFFSVFSLVLIGLTATSNMSRAQVINFDDAPKCYCDSSVEGCYHDGDDTKCSRKPACAGGKCPSKNDVIE